MSSYKVIYFSYCTGCGREFEHCSELDQDALLTHYGLLKGNIIIACVDNFLVSKDSRKCECYKTGLGGKYFFLDKGVIVNQKYDLIQEIFQMDRKDFSKNAKRIKLNQEWKKELETNEMYKCLECDQPFYQPLSEEIEKICPSCGGEKYKRGALQESPKGMYDYPKDSQEG